MASDNEPDDLDFWKSRVSSLKNWNTENKHEGILNTEINTQKSIITGL